MKHSSDPSLDYEADLNFREIAEPIVRFARTWITSTQAKDCSAIPDDPILVEYLVQLDRGQGIELRAFWNRVFLRHLKHEIRALLNAAERQRATAPPHRDYWDPDMWDGTPGDSDAAALARLMKMAEQRWGPPEPPKVR